MIDWDFQYLSVRIETHDLCRESEIHYIYRIRKVRIGPKP